MKEQASRRTGWVACPKCGHKVARVRSCDMEVKCERCGHEYEAVIGIPRKQPPDPKDT